MVSDSAALKILRYFELTYLKDFEHLQTTNRFSIFSVTIFVMTDRPSITKFEDLSTEILVEIFSDFLKAWAEAKSLSIDKDTRKNYDFLRNCREVCRTCLSFSTLTKDLIALRMVESSHH